MAKERKEMAGMKIGTIRISKKWMIAMIALGMNPSTLVSLAIKIFWLRAGFRRRGNLVFILPYLEYFMPTIL